jgi:hypothetical protein
MIELPCLQRSPRSRALVLVGLALAILAVASPAAAAPKDAEAEDLAKKAIYTDYLGTKFADAEKKLKQAITLCEPDAACSPKVRARIRCDLGVVYVGGMNRVDDGKAQFAEAIKQDPSVAPDKDLVSPEIEAAFAEAKKAPGGGEKTPSPKPQPSATPAPTGGGDLLHTPPVEQVTMTPLPLYAELPSGVAATRVQLSYKPFGAGEWKTLEMKLTGKGYGIEVPCAEIGTTTGDFAYFVQAFDGTNNLVSWSGARGTPNKVPIRMAIQADAPHLPGQAPPDKCPEAADCPPEFPGCHDKDKATPACDPSMPDCVPDKPPARKNWLSLAFQQDFLALPGSTTACAGGNGYDCFAGSNYYTGIPYVGSGDVVQGGLAAATSRILLGYDRALGNFTLGARVGVAFRGGPQTPGFNAFMPAHAEGRAAFWFGSDPFARVGLRPYLVLAGGVSQVDAAVEVKLYKTAADYASNNVDHYEAWRKTGLGFVGGGAGLMFAITPRHGIFVEAKFVELLGLSGQSLNLQLGYALGL